MSAFTVKVYVVQKADRKGNLLPEIVGIKLTLGAAHSLAKDHAPAAVHFGIADKTLLPNPPDRI